MTLNVTLDSHIKLDPTSLPEDLITKILSRLNVPNPRKKIAQKEMLYGADSLPDTLELWNWDNPRQLILPRGLIFEFEKILDDNNVEFSYNKEMVLSDYEDVFANVQAPDMRDYQEKAIGELITAGSGIYSSLTGSGKTRVMLDVARRCRQTTIVICEKKDIQSQWIKAAVDLGFESIGEINGDNWYEGEITIALRQSLWGSDKDDRWYEKFGMVIYDENHHLSADTAFELIQKFPAYYRFGCSATPDTDKELFPITRAVIGPVVKHSSREEIGNHLVTPSVRVIKTEFEFPYRPTVREGKKIFRNNYNSMMKELENDWQRNGLISRIAVEEGMTNHCVLVASKRKRHLEILMNHAKSYIIYFSNMGKSIEMYFLTGDNSDDYSEIKNKIENDNRGCILFSTLASEGTDIPILDRLFLAYPGRKLRGYEQAIGRIMRPYPGKTDAVVYDFRDANVSILNSQFRFRCQMYHKKKYAVVDG